jgi:hypothetical protein
VLEQLSRLPSRRLETARAWLAHRQLLYRAESLGTGKMASVLILCFKEMKIEKL